MYKRKLTKKQKIMFRKIISNLSFSPALVGQLSFYAKRLRKEETTRRVGLVFVVLALIVQSLVVFQPAESANASNGGDFVSGGLGLGANRSLNNFLVPYDSNSKNIKDVMNYVGITRAEIAAAQFGSWQTAETLSWGFSPRFSAAQGEKIVPITDANGNVVTTVYARPLKLFSDNNTKIYGWVGYSQKVGWFAIMQACGNLVTNSVPPPPAPPVPPTPPTPPPVVVPLVEKIVQSKTAINVTQGSVSATTVTARASDQITYTITAENTGTATSVVKLVENLEDVLEYSSIVDDGGGTYSATTKTLTWPDITLAPGEKQSRTFLVKMLETIPATAQGASDPSSYNCIMTNVFGNDVTIDVDCADTPKVIEQVVNELPTTGPTENMIFAGIVLSIATYFYARTRQVNKEVRLIRRHLNAGTI